MNNSLALVTGASRGIGAAIALELGRAGMTVIGTATSTNGAEKISAILAEQGYAGRGLVLNVAELASIEQTLAKIQTDFGAPVILVNNAAVTQDNLLLRMKESEWDTVINTNLTSVYRLSKACLKGMLKANWGRIINISSVVGSMGNPGQTNYSAAKAGLIGFTKSLAQEIASRDITVNAIAPGFIDTQMTQALSEAQRQVMLDRIPAKRLGQPKDIAAAVAFLVSNAASYITGQVLHVNGGMY